MSAARYPQGGIAKRVSLFHGADLISEAINYNQSGQGLARLRRNSFFFLLPAARGTAKNTIPCPLRHGWWRPVKISISAQIVCRNDIAIKTKLVSKNFV